MIYAHNKQAIHLFHETFVPDSCQLTLTVRFDSYLPHIEGPGGKIWDLGLSSAGFILH